MNIDEVLKMTEDMELISDFLTNARFVGDRVHVSIEHLADCIRNRPQSEASAEALEVFDAMIKCGEHQMECSFEELLNNMKVKEAKQTIRAALATPMGWRPISSAPKDGTEVLFYSKKYGVFSANIPKDMAHYKKPECLYRGSCRRVLYWMPLPAPPHTEERG